MIGKLCLMSLLTLAPLAVPALGQSADVSPDCLPPEEPYLPVEDDALARYAELIAADFERYFSEVTRYFACMDATRQAEFEQAQQVSEQHRRFLDRLDALGFSSKAAEGRTP